MAKRVYFAFHYQDVIDFRANVVRKHNFMEGVESAGYYDHSIWEEAKKTNAVALKRLINSELENSSTTAVLVGAHTWERRWVRYEIFKSIARGNFLLAIHINGIPGKDQKTKPPGPDPFNNLGLEIDAAGTKAKPTEWKDGAWAYYTDLEPFSVPKQAEEKRGKHLRLSAWYRTYDWAAQDGYSHFEDWIS